MAAGESARIMKPPTVLQITARSDIGGGPEHVLNLSRGLVERGHRVLIAAPQQDPYWSRFGDAVGAGNRTPIKPRSMRPTDIVGLRRVIVDEGIDVVHTHGKGAGIVGRAAALGLDVAVVHTYHGIHLDGNGPIMRRLYVAIERAFSYMTGRVICVSATEKQSALRERLVGDDRAVVIPNGVPKPEVVRTSPPALPIQVLVVIRNNLQKGPDILKSVCQAASSNDDLEFVVACPEGDVESLRQLLGGAVNATVVGPIPDLRTSVAGYGVLLSTSRWEGMPLVVIEAAMAGLPVVATDVVGNSDALLGGDIGFLFDVDAPGRAAEILGDLVDPDIWAAAASRSEKSLQQFSVDAMVEGTASIYGDVCNRSQTVVET